LLDTHTIMKTVSNKSCHS